MVGGIANGAVMGVCDVGWVNVPVVLVLVTDHGYRLCHSVVDMFYATIHARVVGRCREFMYT